MKRFVELPDVRLINLASVTPQRMALRLRVEASSQREL